jgi:hypothetical protein
MFLINKPFGGKQGEIPVPRESPNIMKIEGLTFGEDWSEKKRY